MIEKSEVGAGDAERCDEEASVLSKDIVVENSVVGLRIRVCTAAGRGEG